MTGRDRPADRPLFVGSAKTNWGHTEAAAGLAGLIKAALILHHRVIPPSLHRLTPNPLLSPSELALIIPGEVIPLAQNEAPGIAGVTALGISGTNAHVVLEEARSLPTVEQDPFERWAPAVLLPLSARSPQALRRLATLMADRVEFAIGSGDRIHLLDRGSATNRVVPSRRLCGGDQAALVEGLRDFAEDDEVGSAVFDRAPPKICFVCPGSRCAVGWHGP